MSRELDKEVAEKVFAWEKHPRCANLHPPNWPQAKGDFQSCSVQMPAYSTDISAAFLVVESEAALVRSSIVTA